MTEMLADPILFTADTDFHIYRRYSRQAVPCVMPSLIATKRSKEESAGLLTFC
jgi:hypothetical protein